MQQQTPAQWFSNLNSTNKTIFLSQIVYYFSIIIRDITTSPFNDMTIRRLRGIGETIHRIMPYIVALNEQNPKRYPDKELIDLYFEMGESYGLDGAYKQAWQRAQSVIEPENSMQR